MNEMLEKLGQNAKDAETVLRNLSTNDKNKTLEAVAKALVAYTDEILKKYGPAVGIDRPYLKYRLSEGGKSRNKLKSARMTYHVYRYVGYGPVKSTCFFISYALHGLWKYRKK